MRLLILGGTTEASRLAAQLARVCDVTATLSYAGRTEVPADQPIPVRIGGFGGAEGLARYLIDNAIDLVIDATHPFAARISDNAARAAAATHTPLVVLTRKPWDRSEGDLWTEVADNSAAIAVIGSKASRVFLTIGRLGVGDFRAAPQHHYLIRTIDAPPDADLPPDHALILARGTFDLDAEIRLMRDHAIDVLVTKNSGGAATYAKIAAARALRVPVILVRPPARPDVPTVYSVEDCLDVVRAHRVASTSR